MQKSILVKIHKAEYINDMYENEYLYFSPMQAFKKHDIDTTGRLDSREGNLLNHQLLKLIVEFDGKKIDLSNGKNFNGQYNESYAENTANLCSLYMLEINNELRTSKPVDDRMLEMGDKALIILNPMKFYEILDSALEMLEYGYRRMPVQYYDHRTFEGELSNCHKDIKFNYQNEYRIVIKNNGDTSIKLPLQGLKSVSSIIDSKHLKHPLQIIINPNL